jgi:hypothetical protein
MSFLRLHLAVQTWFFFKIRKNLKKKEGRADPRRRHDRRTTTKEAQTQEQGWLLGEAAPARKERKIFPLSALDAAAQARRDQYSQA